MITKPNQTKLIMLIMIFMVGLVSCEKDLVEPAILDEDAATSARAIYSQRWVDWNNRATGTYSSSAAATDLGNVSGWNDSRAYISNGTCRVTLLANALSGAGGLISRTDISDGSAYHVEYDVRFHSQFDWSRGGKLGFGFSIGDGFTGCNPAWSGNGGTARAMWYNNPNTNRVYIHPYLYYKDMPGTCGDNFGVSYPSSGSIQKGTWYRIKVVVRSNTGSSTNGSIEMAVNGTTILNRSIRWTTNDSKRLVNNLIFHTFRGGSQSYWQSSTVGYIYYDNLWVNKL
jgi:hypothetical protein